MDSDSLLVDKYMSHALFGAGQLVLRPGATKGKQHVRNDTMVSQIKQLNPNDLDLVYSAGTDRYMKLVKKDRCYGQDTKLF